LPPSLSDWYQLYGPMVLRRCRSLLKDEEAAVDAMHDVFVELLRRGDRLEVDSPSSFLYCTATHVCLNKLRSRARRPEDPDDEVIQRIASIPDTQDRTLSAFSLARIFQREQPSTRAIAVAHLLDGLTLDEVAKEFGLSVSGVRKRLRMLRAHGLEIAGGST
jgi:RNA polymerase sigma factor (sigma-70 family)